MFTHDTRLRKVSDQLAQEEGIPTAEGIQPRGQGNGIGSLLNLIYYLWLERDLEFVYGVIYSYYAFFLLQ